MFLSTTHMHTRRKLKFALTSTNVSSPPTSVIEKRTLFRRRLIKFRQLQAHYQPEVAFLLVNLSPGGPDNSAESPDGDSIQDVSLLLPSSLSPEVLRNCSKRLASMEKELRIGQCRDSLSQLRTNLTARARLLKHKYVNVRHQVPNTRARNLLNRVKVKIEAGAVKYSYARRMLQVLDQSGGAEWRSEFLELRPQDIRCMGQAELPSAPTQERAQDLQARTLLKKNIVPEGSWTVSWIWRGSLVDDTGDRVGRKEYGEGLSPNPSHASIGTDAQQSFDMSGPRLERDKLAGKRRSYFSGKRCVGSRYS